MHPDLEKLIDLAVVDGKVTDKEKEILERKARELNVDLDELDMVLEAKLFIQNREDSQENQSLLETSETKVKSSSEQKNIEVTKFFNEDYKEHLRKIICKDKIIFKVVASGGFKSDEKIKIIECIDSNKYLDKNITVNTHLVNSEFLIVISLTELLFHKLFDDIDYIFSKLSKQELEEDDKYFIKLYIDGEKESSKYQFERLIERARNYEHLILGAYCYSILFNDLSQARKCMDVAENYFRGSNDVFYLCEAWKQIFTDDNEAIRIIIDFEKIRWDGKHYPAYTWVALWWKELLNDEREAKRLITLAEEHKYPDWDEIAYIWKRLFNNDDEARRCILKQENGTENISARWISCAESWKKILNDDNEARRCLSIAENIAYKEDKPRIQWCVDARKELFGSVSISPVKDVNKKNNIAP